MSVKDISPLSQSGTSSWRGALSLWPLVIFLLLLATACAAIWHYWPRILLSSIIWQRDLHQQLAAILQQVSTHPAQAGLSLTLFSLIYGVVHAVGPGHGKVVITTYLATHPSRLKTSLRLTFASAVVQGLVAILLVTLVLGVFQLSSRQLHQSSFWMEKGSFILVMLLGIILCWRAIKQGIRQIKKSRSSGKPHSYGMNIQRISPIIEGHQHHENCGCGHQHVPDDRQLQAGKDWRTQIAVVLAMGLRPCSGAIMVLLFSKVIGVYAWGVLSALVMALGTSLTVSLVGFLVFYSRELAVRLSVNRTPSIWTQLTFSLLSLTGGLVLLGAGMILYQSSASAFGGGMGPFGH
ncbi:nickel transporter [Rouxiella silvae]|uniref:Nickel/cobalt efflux system n=1 Tax=Rouxiella silvae TaxID=1646373 RepID=A0AA40X1B2_9GAMM|nr:nickel/cobalt transporter [Rouxiella silvae]MBF6636877.1 nickel/cobalt transporter [Rouxiella silvae]ORJ22572.1 nickel transporter [Rouxiella silvae]